MDILYSNPMLKTVGDYIRGFTNVSHIPICVESSTSKFYPLAAGMFKIFTAQDLEEKQLLDEPCYGICLFNAIEVGLVV